MYISTRINGNFAIFYFILCGKSCVIIYLNAIPPYNNKISVFEIKMFTVHQFLWLQLGAHEVKNDINES
jgi:hypothetical protein